MQPLQLLLRGGNLGILEFAVGAGKAAKGPLPLWAGIVKADGNAEVKPVTLGFAQNATRIGKGISLHRIVPKLR